MSSDRSSADVVPIRSGADDATFVYDEVDEDVAKRDAIAPVERQQVGRYLILGEIGRGGMGVVCTAYDPKLDRKVAIKLIKRRAAPGSKREATGRARLVREAQALAKLNHPNIVTVHDVDTTEDGQLFMAMEFVEGETVAQWLARAPRTWREILATYEKAGRGLAAAHAADITHRDFKPSNVLVTRDGNVKVLDFGLAKNLRQTESMDGAEPAPSRPKAGSLGPIADIPIPRPRSDSDAVRARLAASSGDIMQVVGSAVSLKLTQAGRVVGTPAYMAPEQHEGAGVHPVGAWSDQFSFAVSLYESLYGDLPFEGDFLDQVYWNIRKGRITEPRNTAVPSWVFRVVSRGLASDPADRFASMDAMLAAMADDPAKRRRRVGLGVATASLLAMSGFGAYQAVWGDREHPCEAGEARLSGVWDGEVAGRVTEALEATAVPYARDAATGVTVRLDEYAERWVSTRQTVCEATHLRGEQSDTLLDIRMTCLDQRRGDLAALVDVLLQADAEVVERAVTAAGALYDVAECESARAGGTSDLPTDAEARAAVVALQRELGRLEALIATGQYEAATEAGAHALTTARALDHTPTLATALARVGVAELQAMRGDRAKPLLEEAVQLAARTGNHAAELDAWTNLINLVGYHEGDLEAALALALGADAALSRSGDDAGRFGIINVTGTAFVRAGRFEEALDRFEAAAALLEQGPDRPSKNAGAILTNLGVMKYRLGRRAEAARDFQRALDLRLSTLGPKHPDVASSALALGNALVDSEPERAGALYRQALEIDEEVYGVDSIKAAQVLNSIGSLHKAQGNLGAARRAYERALAVFRRSGDDLSAGAALNNLGVMARTEGDLATAIALHREALAQIADAAGPTHVRTGKTQEHLCKDLLQASELHAARQACEAALVAYRATYREPHADVAVALELLGDIEDQSGHPDRAAPLVREANEIRRALAEPPTVPPMRTPTP